MTTASVSPKKLWIPCTSIPSAIVRTPTVEGRYTISDERSAIMKKGLVPFKRLVPEHRLKPMLLASGYHRVPDI